MFCALQYDFFSIDQSFSTFTKNLSTKFVVYVFWNNNLKPYFKITSSLQFEIVVLNKKQTPTKSFNHSMSFRLLLMNFFHIISSLLLIYCSS